MLDLQPQAVENAHHHIRQEDQRELGQKIPSPASVEQLKSGDDEHRCRNVVTETVLAGEEVEELSQQKVRFVLAAAFAELSRFAKDLLMRDGPSDTGNRKREQYQDGELL